MMIHELREHLQVLGADIIFLQEVQGLHSRHAARFEDWPDEPQYEFLADQVWPEFAYGRNAVYDYGHHGNAILSRYPIVRAENQDVSHHALERRGCFTARSSCRRCRSACTASACTSRCTSAAVATRSARSSSASIARCPMTRRSSSRATSTTGAIGPASASKRTWAWRRPAVTS